jgi:D-glycero-alpha-D-manno-heptose 1-phosphate guanylyltransferase
MLLVNPEQTSTSLHGITVVLLAGGFGSRVKPLFPDLPKPMIPVAGAPFLEWAIRYWASQGAQKIIVSLGHLAHVAETYFSTRPKVGPPIATLREPYAMGTGGALLWAAQSTELSDPFVVANGDSLAPVELSQARNLLEKPGVDGVILGIRVDDAGRFGSLAIGAAGRLLAFDEKKAKRGVINAGVYFFRRRLLERFPANRPLSMETEVFPVLLGQGVHLAVCTYENAPFLDIGTPESLRTAEDFVRTHFQGSAHS